MIKIERILCPTDLSPEADEALRYALAMAKAYDAKLILVYCKQLGSVVDWVSSSRAVDLFRQALFTRLNVDEFHALDWTGVVCEGDDVGLAIANEAQTQKADLIVMRSRRRLRAAALLGSTAETVCRKAPCPVLVTHPNEVDWVGLSTNEIDLHRILVAHDFSPDSELALQYGVSLAQEYQAEVHLLHVLDSADRQEPELAWSASSMGSAYTLTATKLQRALPKEASLWCSFVNAVRYGKAYEEVLAYAREQAIDLICMGSSGNGWNLSKLFGSNVEHVLRQAPCPVLVVRPIKHAD
jgi:nucleotide-binding universal stress UspA family protein